ncbi:TPA: hypothetical protein MD887_003778 [Klebsiella oxytoca]|uniref:hypothetical protein n=1 Tax=Klebsiella grimontii TaxID=2058152 RepID=UPI0031B733F3|nr:hypothetical protein [Klebsiella oxytoca]HBV8970162.1 hypothetical protein [Klebsiella oxytoca]HCA0301673.1 hypothetical protein [Klebsiella oxytoca]HCA1151911.1 hypothetical protein [Klebsiella oxytoca]HCA1998326.1 hypothetical protein [Klebsiella oxytoca]
MALIQDTVIKGLKVENCYIAVGSITLAADRTEIYFNLNFSVTKEHPPLFTDYFTCPYDSKGGEIDEQAYAYLRTLERFSAASVSVDE